MDRQRLSRRRPGRSCRRRRRLPRAGGFPSRTSWSRCPNPSRSPATGVVDYQYFIVDPGFKHDMWVKAAEGKPSNRSVVHHMVLCLHAAGTDRARSGGPAGSRGRLVGAREFPPLITPDGYARRIPAGSKLVFQMHYTPNGTEQIDQSEAGLVFADPATVKKEMQIGAVIKFQFLIPPGVADFRVDGEDKIEHDMLLYALIPHMHLRGKAFRFIAAYPDGHSEILLDVPQVRFQLAEHLSAVQAAALAQGLGVAVRGPFRQFGEQPRQSRSDEDRALRRADV